MTYIPRRLCNFLMPTCSQIPVHLFVFLMRKPPHIPITWYACQCRYQNDFLFLGGSLFFRFTFELNSFTVRQMQDKKSRCGDGDATAQLEREQQMGSKCLNCKHFILKRNEGKSWCSPVFSRHWPCHERLPHCFDAPIPTKAYWHIHLMYPVPSFTGSSRD